MKQIIPFSLIFSLIFLFLFSCTVKENTSLDERLQNVIDDGIREYDVRGVSAAVIFPNDNKWIGVSGVSHDTVSIKPDMLFPIGSITKNFVAALTLKLQEEGRLSLDDPVSKWLKEYPNVNSKITIRQLLNHTSGIYMFWSNQKLWDDLKKDRTKIWTPEEVLSYIKEPYFEPGDGWRYSNTNYLLMAMIIEKVTNNKLSIEFNDRFWKPLSIENAYLSIEQEIPDNQAHVFGDNFNNDGSSYDLTFLPRASHESITFGSSGLFMTGEELAIWCNSLFEGKVLSHLSMLEMLEIIDIGFGKNKRGYGLGVEVFKKNFASGKFAYGHSGANIGTIVYMAHLPEQNFSVVVMINDFNHDCAHDITKNLITTILKDMDVIGIIPYFDFFPLGVLIIGSTTTLILIIFYKILRRRKKIENNLKFHK